MALRTRSAGLPCSPSTSSGPPGSSWLRSAGLLRRFCPVVHSAASQDRRLEHSVLVVAIAERDAAIGVAILPAKPTAYSSGASFQRPGDGGSFGIFQPIAQHARLAGRVKAE